MYHYTVSEVNEVLQRQTPRYSNRFMVPVLLWQRILVVASRLLHKYKINFHYTEDSQRQMSITDVLITIFAESLYFQNYQISTFPEV